MLSEQQAVDNILAVWEAAGATIREEGMGWYQEANKIARGLTSRFWLASHSHSAGVIAVLSPSVQWDTNVKDAETVCAARAGEDVTVSTYGQFKLKAFSIRDGAHPKKWINPISAPKTYAFWQCIHKPTNRNHVVVDRHALATAHAALIPDKERGALLKRKGGYEFYEQCYQLASIRVGVLPLQMQAATWLQWRASNA